MDPKQHIHCLVDNCHYWGQGNMCNANEIIVTSDSFGAGQPNEVDAKRAKSLDPTPAGSCMETCCKTFVSKQGETKVDGVRKMSGPQVY